MALVVHPHPRVEALVEALAAELQRSWPEHPLEPVPMVVGTRGMETWLRHALTTMLGSLSSVEFAFPSAAFEGASAWLRGERAGFEPETAPRARFWAPLPLEDSGWRGPALSARTLTAVRTCLAEGAAELEPLAHYRASTQAVPGGDVEPLEHELATQIGAALERWLHDRPDEALRALNGEPAGVEVTPWLARILRALHQGPHAPSPQPPHRCTPPGPHRKHGGQHACIQHRGGVLQQWQPGGQGSHAAHDRQPQAPEGHLPGRQYLQTNGSVDGRWLCRSRTGVG